MNGWEFLDRVMGRLPGWPNERQWVTAMIFATAWTLLRMAVVNGTLWNVELFKIILQAVMISAIIGSVIAFHFSANNRSQGEPAPKPTDAPSGAPDDPVSVIPGEKP